MAPPHSTHPDSAVWNDDLLANPHAAADKRQRVQRMFAAIAPSYDINNRLHSLWMDQRWRNKAVKLAAVKPTDWVVDVACGTGDLTLKFADAVWRPDALPKTGQILGIDFTYAMLPIAREKSRRVGVLAHGLANQERSEKREARSEKESNEDSSAAVRFINGDAMTLPLPDACCDIVSIAFGIRNVADPAAAIREFRRILRPGGRLVILEFSLPTNRILRGLYNFYFRKILPITATWISRDKTGAYKYLPESVNTFIDRNTMVRMMSDAGFGQVTQHPLTFGVCVCYRGVVA